MQQGAEWVASPALVAHLAWLMLAAPRSVWQGPRGAPTSDSPANVKCWNSPAGSHLVVTFAAAPGAPCVRHRPPPAAFAMVRPADGTTASWSKNAVAKPMPAQSHVY